MKLTAYILLGLVGLLTGTFAIHVLANYPGLIVISVGDSVIEMGFWFGVIALVGSLTILVLSWKTLMMFCRWLASSVSWIQESRSKKAERRTEEGLIQFVEGNWNAAKKNLLSAAKDTNQPLVHYLAAAKSAYEMGSREESTFLLEQAVKISSDKNVSVILSKARIQVADKEYETCLTTLKCLSISDQKNAAALDLKQQSYIGLQKWELLKGLLPQLKTCGLFSEDTYQELEEKVYRSILDQSANKSGDSKKTLTAVWEGFPKQIRKKVNLIGLYCTCLHRLAQTQTQEEDETAAALIKKTLKNHWHIGLVELYGKLKVKDVKAQLNTAEQWLSAHKDDAHLHFALGKLSVNNSLWGKAKDYFNASLAIQERPEVYAELAALMAHMGEQEQSASMYKKGLLLKIA